MDTLGSSDAGRARPTAGADALSDRGAATLRRSAQSVEDARRLFERGDLRAAAECLQRALAHDPHDYAIHLHLGDCLAALGDRPAARDAFLHAAALDLGSPDAHCALGALCIGDNASESARRHYAEALRRDAACVEAHVNLANLCRSDGDARTALDLYRRALALGGDPAMIQNNIALAQLDLGRADAAVEAARSSLAFAPDQPIVLNTLGTAQRRAGQTANAMATFARAHRTCPGHAPTALNLAGMLIDEGRYGEARSTLAGIAPSDTAKAHAVALEAELERATGNASRAATLLRDRVATGGASDVEKSNYLFALHFVPDLEQGLLTREHRRVGPMIGVTASRQSASDATRDRPAASRLRLAYLSPDFANHPVGSLIEPVIRAHDRSRWDVLCIHTDPRADAMTQRIRQAADGWLACPSGAALVVAAAIRELDIDVLVDLAGHTGGNRLDVLRLRPARHQGTYLGFPSTTGVQEVDFRLTDAQVDPDGWERYSAERLIRLPHSYYCFPEPDSAPEVLPRATGPVTFGSLNNFAKVNADVLALWFRVLAAVSDSTLLLKARAFEDAHLRRSVSDACRRAGVASERLRFAGWTDAGAAHLAHLHEVDVALDSFPYNGATTTFDALWMGVPVVTLEGRTHAGRMGASILRAAGLDELVAVDKDDYLDACVRVARDTERRREWRCTLRDRLRASPLMDLPRHVRALEDAYLAAISEES